MRVKEGKTWFVRSLVLKTKAGWIIFLTFCKKYVKIRDWTSGSQGPLQCLSKKDDLSWPGKANHTCYSTTLVIPSFPSSQGGEAAEPRISPVSVLGADFGGCCRTRQKSPNETALCGKSLWFKHCWCLPGGLKLQLKSGVYNNDTSLFL